MGDVFDVYLVEFLMVLMGFGEMVGFCGVVCMVYWLVVVVLWVVEV